MISKKHLAQNILLGLICAMSGYSSASAMPTGEHGLQNIDSITRAGSVMDIVGSGNSVAKWQDFSIGKGETVNFKGMNNVLNIVDGHRFSTIRGAMNGQGVNVYLVNPSGVMFGAESSVNVGSLNVSTQEVSKDLENEFLKSGNITPDTSKLGFGDVTFVGNINADSIKVEGNNISLASTDLLNAKDVSLATPKGGFINVLKGQDTSKLDVSGGSVRDDFEAIDSQDKLSNLKSGGHYMLTKDVAIDDKWTGANVDDSEQFTNYRNRYWDSSSQSWVIPTETRNKISGLIVNGMGHSISGMNNCGLFEKNTKGYDITLANMVLDGDTFTKDSSDGSALLMDNAERLRADNIVSNYKNAVGHGAGLFGTLKDGKIFNVVNNTNHGIYDGTGNIVYQSDTTNFQNVINNGSGRAGIAYTMNNGNIIASENNGNMERAGFVENYNTHHLVDYENPGSGEYLSQDDVILGNVNNGIIGDEKDRLGSGGHTGGIIAEATWISSDKGTLLLYGNENKGAIYGEDYVGAFIGDFSGSANDTAKDNSLVLLNNSNYANLYGNAAVGLIGNWQGTNLLIKDSTNYGDLLPFRTSWTAMGGIVGQIDVPKEISSINIENVTNYGAIGAADNRFDTGHYYGNYDGGIIGRIDCSQDASMTWLKISHARNFGTVYGAQIAGGIIGRAVMDGSNNLHVADSFNMGDIKAYSDTDNIYNGGIVGDLNGKGSNIAVIQNVYNAGNIDVTGEAGGIIGHVDRAGKGNEVGIFSSFNSGNINSKDQNAGGIIGGLSGVSRKETVMPEDDKNEQKGPETNLPTSYPDVSAFNYDGDWVPRFHFTPPENHAPSPLTTKLLSAGTLSIKDFYTTGSVTTGKGSVNDGSAAPSFKDISIKNAYSSKGSSLLGSVDGTANIELNNVYSLSDQNEKKSSSFDGFDIDTNGSRKDATWRMYEGRTNPLLTVFMNDVKLDDTGKIVEYNGKEQSFSNDELHKKNDFGKQNFFTDYLDYSKENPVYDQSTDENFNVVSGTEPGTYSTKLYSTQLGYNFHTKNNDDTVSLTINKKPDPPKPVDPPISTIYPIYNFHIKKGDYSFIDKNVLLDKTEQTRAVKKNKLVINQTKVEN